MGHHLDALGEQLLHHLLVRLDGRRRPRKRWRRPKEGGQRGDVRDLVGGF